MVNLSSHSVWLWLAPLGVALVMAFALTPMAIGAAYRLRILDWPTGLKIHARPTPLLGGVAVYIAFAVGCLLFLPASGPVRGLLAGGAIAVMVGVLDDRCNLPPLVHLAGQVLAAAVVIVAGLGAVKTISNPFASASLIAHGQGSWTVPAALGIGFSLVWLVGMMNTINFLDGLDGLSSGIGIIAAAMLAWWAANQGNYFAHPAAGFHHADLVLPVILAGALLGFLPFNWNPARIFIGDSGAMFVGIGLGAMSLLAPAKIGTALLVLSIPVLDVAWAIVRRQLHGKSFLAGDKQHVYHRMIELGMSRRTTVVALYALCIALGLVDLALTKFAKLLAFAIVVVVTGTIFIILEIAGNRRKTQASLNEQPRAVNARG